MSPPWRRPQQPWWKAAGAGRKEWLVVSESGDSHLEEVGKHWIMRRTGLPARDLRIIDPMLSYPSTVLGRQRAIVVNLEHIKAIVTATEVLVLSSKNPQVTAFVEDLLYHVCNHHSTPRQVKTMAAGVGLDDTFRRPTTSHIPATNLPTDSYRTEQRRQQVADMAADRAVVMVTRFGQMVRDGWNRTTMETATGGFYTGEEEQCDDVDGFCCRRRKSLQREMNLCCLDLCGQIDEAMDKNSDSGLFLRDFVTGAKIRCIELSDGACGQRWLLWFMPAITAAESSDIDMGVTLKSPCTSPSFLSHDELESPIPWKAISVASSTMAPEMKDRSPDATFDAPKGSGTTVLPFEFIVLEVCLQCACKCLESEQTLNCFNVVPTQASLLEKEAYPALDELTSQISTLNLERVRRIKRRLVDISGRVQKVRDELERLLDEDMDMAEMYLTDKLVRRSENTSSVAELDDDVLDVQDERQVNSSLLIHGLGLFSSIIHDDSKSRATSGYNNSGGSKPNIEELEMLLEAYFKQIEGTLSKLSTVCHSPYIHQHEMFLITN
ncbi:hypothetical protein ACLOJK_033141 [Asimina triloba]